MAYCALSPSVVDSIADHFPDSRRSVFERELGADDDQWQAEGADFVGAVTKDPSPLLDATGALWRGAATTLQNNSDKLVAGTAPEQ